ncbi:hypothetical protein [Algoriphagus limi]|uniref:Uncharacterized protein n=1 Tax=Algoriphagus limi TaxID=2975273 RepID=A0ABT2G6X7_9BACT|nr:hypothetical protein [Algoriphagus limi]MCS5491014.1 hypothetical protein [Algoriphagus limi]
MTGKNTRFYRFIWRITASHTIAYFFAGLFGLFVVDYKAWFSEGAISTFMLPTDTPIVALGPALQLFRGIIMALVLWPIYQVIIEGRRGFLKLWLLILGLSVFSTFAAAMGSIDGFIYTNVPISEQVMGYPEAFLWASQFVGILWVFYKFEKRAINLVAIILFVLIIFMSVMGYLDGLGMLTSESTASI